MRSKIHNHLSPPMLLALLALFVALGGGAYAAGQVKKNSVDSKSVQNNSLKGGDIMNETITGADVRDGTLSGDDIQAGSIKPGDLQGGGAVTGAAIVDNSVTGADVDESTLDINEAALDVRRVVARARSTGSTAIDPDENGFGTPPDPIATISLTGNTFTRAANETNAFTGQFSYTVPANCAPTTAGAIEVDVTDGPDLVATSGPVNIPIGTTGTFPGLIFGGFEAIEGGQKNRTLVASARALCEAGASDLAVSDLKLNVEGIR